MLLGQLIAAGHGLVDRRIVLRVRRYLLIPTRQCNLPRVRPLHRQTKMSRSCNNEMVVVKGLGSDRLRQASTYGVNHSNGPLLSPESTDGCQTYQGQGHDSSEPFTEPLTPPSSN